MTSSEHLIEPVKGVNNEWKCPHCGNTTSFRVEAKVPVDLTVRDNGQILMEVDAEDPEWQKDAFCLCLNDTCGAFGPVKDFNPNDVEEAKAARRAEVETCGHRPDDSPEPGDRCKYCGVDLTWLGPGMNDWAPTADAAEELGIEDRS